MPASRSVRLINFASSAVKLALLYFAKMALTLASWSAERVCADGLAAPLGALAERAGGGAVWLLEPLAARAGGGGTVGAVWAIAAALTKLAASHAVCITDSKELDLMVAIGFLLMLYQLVN